MHVAVAYANKSTSLAAESMLQREAGTTTVTLVREVGGALSVSDGDTV